MTVQEIIDKNFKEEKTIWFDFKDYMKANYGKTSKGLSYRKKFGKYEIYIVDENGDEVLFDCLENSEGYKLENILTMMLQ
jgi:hypothetical protein